MEQEQHDDKLREYGAVTAMQLLLEHYAEKYHVTIDEALDRFARSRMYEALFDYETELWKEGPLYLLDFYEKVREAEEKNTISKK